MAETLNAIRSTVGHFHPALVHFPVALLLSGAALEAWQIANEGALRSGIARTLLMLGLLGAVVFLAMGFALAGISKSEDQVAPLANLITLPMTLLSGIFFSRMHLPRFAHIITDFFPLTYLADGMRSVAIEGAGLAHVAPQVAGLVVWAVVSCAAAVKMFRWE